jgi:hypothetical protein
LTYLAYAVRAIETGDITARIARRLQSRASSELLSALKEQAPPATAQSKSHSRAVMAVAIGYADDLRLGIDVEWTGAGRPVEAIASYLAWGAVDADAFYRGWTFAEAYFKAFQSRPPKALVVHAIATRPADVPVEMEGGICLFQRRVRRDFQLSLVWRCANAGLLTPSDTGLPVV